MNVRVIENVSLIAVIILCFRPLFFYISTSLVLS